ncbi:MAG: ABC-F family ATP-binding cassette domain-containing protein [Alteromonadaceae bacterium]|nr:ABC-F family ATP-binding cassette domain-containing protein [Alteromonadaceae bacterium]
MPVLQAHNISYEFSDGHRLFDSLSLTLSQRRVGLVGRNGAGKSVLGAILAERKKPTRGNVSAPIGLGYFAQQSETLLSGSQTVAEFLGGARILTAIERIESGDCHEKWFEIVGDNWHLPVTLSQQLRDMGLPADPDTRCASLSGGQRARLQLWQLFNCNDELLILDEPSNHLDKHARRWLLQSLKEFQGHVLLISHDRQLLREMDEIWELSNLGLQVYGGNFDDFAEQKHLEQQAIERRIASVEKQQNKLLAQAQREQEKAEQRAARGNKLRKSGSQSTVLLDAQKNRATARSANRNKNVHGRQVKLADQHSALKNSQAEDFVQSFTFNASHSPARKVISVEAGQLLCGTTERLYLNIRANEKLHLCGANGCGKSTLLKTFHGLMSLKAGRLRLNTATYYLDQHFGVIQQTLSLYENLINACAGINEADARTLLASIGFRRDTVFTPAKVLSGGEKMKLAMLMVSQQSAQPFLLLDEPDNHLDLDSKNALAKALNMYRGGFVLVSHDDDFVRAAGVQRAIAMKG